MPMKANRLRMIDNVIFFMLLYYLMMKSYQFLRQVQQVQPVEQPS